MTPIFRQFAARPRRRLAASVAALLLLPLGAAAQTGAEEQTARYFDAIRGDSVALGIFVREMPKGGDLHSHLSGTVYAESYLRWAAEDGLCVNTRRFAILSQSCTPNDTLRLASQIPDTSALYAQMVDAMSMRNWDSTRISGHDQFFNSFRRMGSTDRRVGDMLAEAATRAAVGGVRYLELMMTPDAGAARTLGGQAGWTDDFARMRDTLLALGLPAVARTAAARLDGVEARRDTLLGCLPGQVRQAGCDVEVRWLYQVARGGAPQQVFAQILLGFLMADADRTVVGLNLVQPEDGEISMRDYSLHMRMIRYLRGLYPDVRVTLHAGELAPGLVPDEGLRFHIREAVRVAGARRIGHGADVMHEDSARELMEQMAREGVMVEIALTSNDVILGIRGAAHPLHAYMAAGVPVALATDDEGVARSEMTMEYLKAVRDQNLGYPALKTMARTSLQHAFIQGEPLWRDLNTLAPAPACARSAGGWDGRRCRAFLARSPRARLQRDLERRFGWFETRAAQMLLERRATAGAVSR
ncbi:adenosine deaminase family protein [Longimicrobium sp.]|uniref:adenosine deaminase family protein n=1 Tax=Longimicrobium sp. TaxID=2029185 RepID=UPI003B3A0572